MVVLYQYAELNNLMVVGEANRTEWLTGTFSKWGVNHCADIMPVLHIYWSQLEQIAEYLEIPDFIWEKNADSDIIPRINNKGQLLSSFSLVDQVLVASENGFKVSELYEIYGKNNVDQILSLKSFLNKWENLHITYNKERNLENTIIILMISKFISNIFVQNNSSIVNQIIN